MKPCRIIITLLFIFLSTAQCQAFDDIINEHSAAVESSLGFTGLNGTLWEDADSPAYLGLKDGIWYVGYDDYDMIFGGKYFGDGKVFVYVQDPEYYRRVGISGISVCTIYEDATGYHFYEFGFGLMDYIYPVIYTGKWNLKQVDWRPLMYVKRFRYAQPKYVKKSMGGYIESGGLPGMLMVR
jgi:hypothetical protein